MARANRFAVVLALLVLLCGGIGTAANASDSSNAPNAAGTVSLKVCILNLKNLNSSKESYWLDPFIADGIEKKLSIFPNIIFSRGEAGSLAQDKGCPPGTDFLVYGDFRGDFGKTDGRVAIGLKCASQKPASLPKQLLLISSLSDLRSDLADASEWLAGVLGVSDAGVAGGQEHFPEVEGSAPVGPEAIVFYGKALSSPDHSPERGLWFRKALGEAPDYAEALYESGIYHYETGDPARALIAFEWLSELHPDYPNIYYNLGLANRALGRHSIAVQMYLEALERNPRDAGAWNNLGVAYHEAEMPDAAADAFGRALALDPANPDILKNLRAAGRARVRILMKHVDAGAAFYLNGEYYRAEESLKKALAIDPGNFKANNNIAMTYVKLGLPGKAKVHFERALQSNPAAEEIRGSIAKLPPDTLRSSGDGVISDAPVESVWIPAHAEVGDLARIAAPAGVSNPAGVGDSAGVQYTEKAAAPDIGWDEEQADSPAKASALETAGRIYLSRGSYSRAADTFERALRESPDLIGAIIGLGSAYVGTGDYAKARLQFSRALDLEPDNEIAQAHMAGIEYVVEPPAKREGKSGGKAASAADPLLKMEARASLIRGNAHWEGGRYAEALGEYLRSLDFDPVLIEALNNLAVTYYMTGSHENARAALKKARLLDPDSGLISQNIDTLDSLDSEEDAVNLEIFTPGSSELSETSGKAR